MNTDFISRCIAGEALSGLAGKQDTLTAEQLEAVNSGITASRLTTDENAIAANTTKINSFGYSIESIILADQNINKLSSGMFYLSSIDASSKFEVLFAATVTDFGNFVSNIAVTPAIKPGTARYALWICDPTNPTTLPIQSNTKIDVVLFGILKSS